MYQPPSQNDQRNPKGKKREDLFDYEAGGSAEPGDVPAETALRGDKNNWLADYAQIYEQHPSVIRHVADAREKWEAMLTLNDGGITLLAGALAPVCDPDLKYDQIAPRSQDLARQILADATRNGGFPPLMLDPIDFASMYQKRQAEAQAQGQAAPSGPIV